MKAKDLMIPVDEYLHPETTLKQAVNRLRTMEQEKGKAGVKGLPVLDPHGMVIGMLSMNDILKAVHPSYLNLMNLGDFTWDGMVEELAKKAAGRKIEDIMNRTVFAVKENDSLMECVDHMIKNCLLQLPVVNESGHVVGMIFERDVFYAVVKAILE